MNGTSCKIGQNILRLRRERKIRQEELADFVGVTKASVSKWENGQTMPDIALLPLLASFFDISIDELIGYEPQLSKQQIQKIYQELSAKFAECPFREVMEESHEYVKRYYSCYPLLLQIGLLWLNHSMLADKSEVQEKVLEAAAGLFLRVENAAEDMALCSDAAAMRAFICLMQGRADEVVGLLEETNSPIRIMTQTDTILTQAYLMKGDRTKADSYTQCSMYRHIFSVIANAVQYLSIHTGELPVIAETVFRVEQIDRAYALTKLNPNTMAQFAYQAAVSFVSCGEKESALAQLGRYVDCLSELMSMEELVLHRDAYFNRMDEWFEQLDLGPNAPRSRKTVEQSLPQTLMHPAFAAFMGDPEFERLKKKLSAIIGT